MYTSIYTRIHAYAQFAHLSLKTVSAVWNSITRKKQKVFRSIKQNNLQKFTTFDIKKLRKSIKEVLLKKELDHTIISSSDKSIIHHVRKSLLFNNKETCIKREIRLFNVSIGAYDIVEACELAGNSLLPQLRKKHDKRDIGFYRNDEFVVFKNKVSPTN